MFLSGIDWTVSLALFRVIRRCDAYIANIVKKVRLILSLESGKIADNFDASPISLSHLPSSTRD